MPLTNHIKNPGVAGLALGLRFAEFLWLILAGWLAYVLRQGSFFLPGDYVVTLLLGSLSFALFTGLLGAYRTENMRKFSAQLPALLVGLALAFAVVVILLFGFKSSAGFSRLWVIIWLMMATIGVLLMRRLAARRVRRKIKAGRWQRRVAIYGATSKTEEMLRLTLGNGRTGVALYGVYANLSPDEATDWRNAGLYKGDLATLLRDGLVGRFDDVIIAEDITALAGVDELLAKLHQLPVNVLYCLPLPLFGRVQTYELLPGVPLVMIYHRPLEGPSRLAKRVMDVTFAGLALLCLLPILAAVAVAIKASSPGPIFFRQKRNGFNGTEFEMLKFRSMHTSAPSVRDASGKEQQARRNDPRITPVGRFIRRTSIDELPQLINVLRGDMSLVGPRPHVPSHNSYYENLIDRYASRHKMRPGLTGWAQVNGWRGETETLDKMAKRVEYDIWYAEHWSLLLDLKIIFLTPLVLFFQKQAY